MKMAVGFVTEENQCMIEVNLQGMFLMLFVQEIHFAKVLLQAAFCRNKSEEIKKEWLMKMP